MISNVFRKEIHQKKTNPRFKPSRFQDERGSTVLVREGVRGSKVRGAFDKKACKLVKNSAPSIAIPPDGYKVVKRDVAQVSDGQKGTIEDGEKEAGEVMDAAK